MSLCRKLPTAFKAVVTLLFAVIVVSSVLACGKTKIAGAQARSEIAMEVTSGTVLNESNADERLPMASTTKIMTALIVAEDCDLDKVVTVPDEAVGVEGSSVYLKKDEQIDIRDLLYGLMLRSGNDCATALAIIHSGSVKNFVEKMNEKAKQIGAVSTNFMNPSGLPDDEHYTTARDLCKIACFAMKNPIFHEVVSTKSYKGKFRSYANKNKMLANYDGANGVKTGYTVKAGRCLVSSAERNGMEVVCVVLNCPDMYERSTEILDKSFDCYELLKLDENKHFMCDKVLCKLKNSSNIVIKKNSYLNYRVTKLSESQIDESDGAIAELKIYDKNSLIFKGNLYSI